MSLCPQFPGPHPSLERKARAAAHRLLDRVAMHKGDPDPVRIEWALRVTGDLPTVSPARAPFWGAA